MMIKDEQLKIQLAIIGIVSMGYIYFNRNPNRNIPSGLNFVAPADGTIKKIENNRIEIFIGLDDVHFQRSPFIGIVTNIVNQNSSYNKIEITTIFGNVVIERWSGILARTVITNVKIGDIVNKGEIIGRILLGSHCAIQIPDSIKIKVKVGDHILAGETIIAE